MWFCFFSKSRVCLWGYVHLVRLSVHRLVQLPRKAYKAYSGSQSTDSPVVKTKVGLARVAADAFTDILHDCLISNEPCVSVPTG